MPARRRVQQEQVSTQGLGGGCSWLPEAESQALAGLEDLGQQLAGPLQAVPLASSSRVVGR